jgi:hypothetical protein
VAVKEGGGVDYKAGDVVEMRVCEEEGGDERLCYVQCVGFGSGMRERTSRKRRRGRCVGRYGVPSS